jgi:hypothetical protein
MSSPTLVRATSSATTPRASAARATIATATSVIIVNTPTLDRAPRRRSTARDALACGIAR